jgi:uncharacterized protein YegL
MQGKPLEALAEGVQTFRDQLVSDPVACRRVEIAVVTYDSNVRVLQPFISADHFDPPMFNSQGFTYTGTAILKALDLIDERKSLYRANGIAYFRPWVLLITDGAPQGEPDHIVEAAAQRLKEDEENKRVAFYAVGVQDADMPALRRISVRPPTYLRGLDFNEMFVWLSTSMQKIAQSGTNEEIEDAPPGEIETQTALPSPR